MILLMAAGRRDGESTRGTILALVERHPGIHKSALCRRLGLAWGSVGHHLQHMEREGMLQTRTHGRQLLVFPAGMDLRQMQWIASLRDAPGPDILTLLRESPGASIQDLSSELGLSRKVIRRHLYGMRDAGLVDADDAYHARYRLTDQSLRLVRQHLYDGVGPAPPDRSVSLGLVRRLMRDGA